MRKIFLAVLILATCGWSRADRLWQIGQEDGKSGEFALVGHAEDYQNDPVFVIGSSVAAKDWPFVQPGPIDTWAGKRPHTFSIIFGLSGKPASGDCILHVALADTQERSAPLLNILINGQTFEQQTPNGGGSLVLHGEPGTPKPYSFDIHFPAELLHAGPNSIDITTVKGSWILYDAVSLNAPAGAHVQKLGTFTLVTPQIVRALVKSDGIILQPIELTIRHNGPATLATISAEGASIQRQIEPGSTDAELLVPPVEIEKTIPLQVTANGQTFESSVTLKPVRKLTIYILHHSHHDLGYTDLQANVEQKQMENLRRAIAIARQTANYPPGARFVWNTEVLWSTDQFMHQASPEDRAAFIDAIKKGQIALNGMYANTLTGLCRPEELLELFRYGTRLSKLTGVKIDTAVQSDVPGMTWGTATAMAQAGIRYFSLAPNWFDRIGSLVATWQDKPFWWVSPSGKDKILVWIPYYGYALSHVIGHLSPQWTTEYEQRLDDLKYPYDITYIRWAGHGDNAEPDEEISEFVKDWNTQYAWPRYDIASSHEIFSSFEKRYGNKLPEYKGDLTPYWEDGAASSALETEINRNNGEKLVQAEALMVMRGLKLNPPQTTEKPPLTGTWIPNTDGWTGLADAFADAWRNILLYSEHTWGAYCSVSYSEWAFTKAQWAVKRDFAIDAWHQAEQLLAEAAGTPENSKDVSSVDVYNTTSWPREELAMIPKSLSDGRDHVTDQKGKAIASQRLSDGDLAAWVSVPPFSGIRLNLSAGPANAPKKNLAAIHGNILDNGLIHIQVEEKTGGISALTARHIKGDFAKSADGEPLNDYVYLPGSNLADARGSGPAKITVLENGPLVAKLRIESTAPGCNSLTHDLELTAGADFVQITDTLDKKRVALNPHMGRNQKASGDFAQRGSKESVSFAFPFNVPSGQIRLDIPLGNMRPELDQLPGSCKNWLPVGRFADVSNSKDGITLAILDAPLVEIGKLSTLLGSQRDPSLWRKHIEPTQKIYSWVMNNHWGTNYRAYQEGVVPFRYALRPHAKYDPADAARFSTNLSQPLIVAPATGNTPRTQPLLTVEPNDVLVQTLKPSDDGKAWIVRLFGASGKDRNVKLHWPGEAPSKIYLSDVSEDAGMEAGESVKVPGWGLVTLRAEHP